MFTIIMFSLGLIFTLSLSLCLVAVSANVDLPLLPKKQEGLLRSYQLILTIYNTMFAVWNTRVHSYMPRPVVVVFV